MSGISKTVFTSDLHFSHKNIVKFTDRGVATTQEEHDEWLVNLWNKEVNPGDLVYHLGDFSFAKNVNDIVKLLSRLNGVKHFVKGNHDSSDNVKYIQANCQHIRWHQYLERNFKIDGKQQTIVMFHFPISSWHKQGHGSWHLHGHCHGNHTDNKGLMLDVGLDSAYNIYGEHLFFTLDEVSAIMKEKQIYIADHHKEIKE